MIRFYKSDDIKQINKLGKFLWENYNFKLDIFSKCIVLINEGNIIGFAIYSIIYERAELIDIVIDINYRNKGFGKKLMMFILDEIRSNNCKNITLEVSARNNNAIRFYESLGFEKINLIKGYYFDRKKGLSDDGYLMQLII